MRVIAPPPPPTVTFDADRLALPAQRRWNAAWLELAARRVGILPQVVQELSGGHLLSTDADGLRDRRQQIDGALHRLQPPHVRQRLRLMQARWWVSELLRDDSPYELIPIDPDANERVLEVLAALPASCFPHLDHDEIPYSRCATAVAEALVTGHTLLVTGRMNGVLTASLNEWAAKCQRKFDLPDSGSIHVQDDLLVGLYGASDAARQWLCGIAMAAAWPTASDTSDPAIFDAVTRQVDSLQFANLRGVSALLERVWRECRHRQHVLAIIRSKLPQRMLESEFRHPVHKQLAADFLPWILEVQQPRALRA